MQSFPPPVFVLPCPTPARLLLPSPAVVSGEFPRCAGTADTDPKHPEPAGPSNPNLEYPPEDVLRTHKQHKDKQINTKDSQEQAYMPTAAMPTHTHTLI